MRNTIDDRAGWSPAPERLGTPGSTCTPEEIARALSSILRSAPFRGAPLLRTLISFLVRHSQEDEAPSLNATTIAVEALGKGPRFRSHKDASVRVAMNRLRTALQLYYAQEGVNDDIVIVLEPRNNRPLFRRRPEARDPDSIEAALQLAASYQSILSPAANRSTLRVVQKELRSNPNHPLLLAAYTDLCLDSHKFNFGSLQHPMDEARRAMARAAPRAQPEYQVLHVQACLALTQGDVDHARRNAETLISAGPENVEAALLGEFLMAHCTTPTLAMEKASISPDDCRNTIPWLHITPFLAAYTTERYEAALESAVNFGLPHFFWGPALRAAALAQVGLKEAARSQVDKVVTLNADFAEAPRWYLQHHIRHEDTLDHVLEGLYKAGLPR